MKIFYKDILLKYNFPLKTKWIIILLLFVSNISYSGKIGNELIDSLKLEINKSEIHDTIKIKFYGEISFAYYSIDPTKGINYADSGIKLAQSIKDPIGELSCLNGKGVNLWKISMFSEALNSFLSALQIAEKLKESKSILRITNNIGLVYLDQLDNEKALNYFQKVHSIAIDLNDKKLIAISLGNIGIAYKKQNNFIDALSAYFESLKMLGALNDSFSMARTEGNIGYCLMSLKKYKNAIFYSQKALDYFKKIGDNYGIMTNLGNLGTIYLSMVTDTAGEIKNFNKSEKTAYIYKSINDFNNAIEIAKKLNDSLGTNDWHGQLSKAYTILGNWKEAYEHKNFQYELNQLIIKKEEQIKIKRLEDSREKDLKEKQIEILNNQKDSKDEIISIFIVSFIIVIVLIIGILNLLKQVKKKNLLLNEQNEQIAESNIELNSLNLSMKDESIKLVKLNDKLAQSEQELKEADQTKNKFLSIISHDLRGPFSGFIGLTQLMAEESDNFSKEELKEFSKKMQVSAKGLYDLLENLLQWSRFKRGMIEFNPMEFVLSDLINENIDFMINISKQKEIIIENTLIPDLRIKVDHRMFNSILRNLISNAIKFSNRNSKIEAGAYLESSKAVVYIKDYGVGMDKDSIKKLFKLDQKVSSAGTEGEASTGLGLLLCKEFVEKHGGKIWVESEEGKGSTFYFTMPIIEGKT
jgi:signal transduction histidine kinase